MSLPSPTLAVPSLLNDQVSFNGVTIGYPPNTPYGITKIEGLGKPKVRSGNTSRPRSRGSFVGLNLLDSRTITLTLDIGPPFGTYATLAGALAALRTAAANEGTSEYPLWIQLPGQPLVCCMARVVGFDPPWDVTADLGSLIKGVPLQFEATDPYLYTAPTQNPTIGLPTPSGGFSFPLVFPWSFGGASTANQYTFANVGDVACYPVLVITGPCLNPSVSNISVAGNPTLTFDIQMNAGDQLVVDCDMQSIVFYPSGSTVGSPEPNLLQSSSTFFALPGGQSSTIAFNSQDTSAAAGTLQIWAASAYDGLTG